jgi:von Willebrand factor type A domain-containing protein
MISRNSSPWNAALGVVVAQLFAISACSSDDSKGATVDRGGAPMLNAGDRADGIDGLFETGENAGTATEFDSAQACVGQEAGTELAPSILELLVDTSLSMNEDAPGSNRSKWVETRRVLLEGIDLMPNNTSVGVVFYPDVDTNAATCFDKQADVSVAPLGGANSAQRSEIRRAFQAQNPRGSTPTHDAYRYALDELAAVTNVGQRFLVLITDGTPTYALNCQGSGTPQDPADPTPLIPEAASALGRGMKTFVIGSPGSEDARKSLSQMAQAGGTATPSCSHDGRPQYCHFDMTQKADFATALKGALASISGLALSCTYDIPAPPNGGTLDPGKVNVLFTPPEGDQEVIARSPAGTCSDGWQYSTDQTQVLLCGETCDRVRASSGRLSLEFGCNTRVIF